MGGPPTLADVPAVNGVVHQLEGRVHEGRHRTHVRVRWREAGPVLLIQLVEGLEQLLDRGGVPVRGDYVTVCNTGLAPDYSAPTGAGYRMIADLADPSGGLWAIDAGSESGHPGSPHYDDQLDDWVAARYHYVPLKREGLAGLTTAIVTLQPIL